MATSMIPPVARVTPRPATLHGDTRVDDYFWLRDRSNPEVIAYLEAENRYTAAMMQPAAALQEKLYREMVGRIQETDTAAPEKMGGYTYYTRTEAGKQYPIHCRRQDSTDGAEEILLDQNELAAAGTYLDVGVFEVSPDGCLLAYSVDLSGAEVFTLYVKDLAAGQLRPEQISNTYYSLAWANDNRTFFYTRLDEAKRPYQLYRHTVGTDPRDDVLVFHEPDELFFLSVYQTRSRGFIVLQLQSRVTSEVHVLPADQPGGQFQVIQPRQHGLEYSVEHWRDQFFILTNDGAKNFRVMTAPVANPVKEAWQEFLPHRPAVKIDTIAAFRDHLAVFEREDGLPKIRVISLPSHQTHNVDFPEPAYACRPGGNKEFNTPLLRFIYSSLATPDSAFDYDMNSRSRTLVKQEAVLGGYDPVQYQVERVYAPAADGVQVPISLVYKKGLARDGSSPMLLYAYGSYGASIDPGFAASRLSLLERGFVFAIAHIRGGGELGRPWYEGGKLLHKRNTFTDFIACAEHLVAEKYTSSDRLAIQGGSAGGLLMGAVVNMRPDLFKVVVARVPFVDVINTMLDPSIPLTATEFEEWGNPADKTYYDYMKAYSPYDNVEAKAYPHMLVTTGLNDPRVQYWEPAKWVARLRALKTDQNLLLLFTDMAVGHGGPSGRYDYLRETAFIYAFILNRLDIHA